MIPRTVIAAFLIAGLVLAATGFVTGAFTGLSLASFVCVGAAVFLAERRADQVSEASFRETRRARFVESGYPPEEVDRWAA